MREALNGTVAGEALEKFAERSTVSAGHVNGKARFQHSASGTLHTFSGVHSWNIYQEILMKRIAIALVLGSLFFATQTVSADSFKAHDRFPVSSYQDMGIDPISTYQDAHPGDPARNLGAAFPEGTVEHAFDLPSRSSYEDAHAGDPVRSAGTAFPEGTIEHAFDLPSRSTYAASHLNQPAQSVQSAQAGGNSVN